MLAEYIAVCLEGDLSWSFAWIPGSIPCSFVSLELCVWFLFVGMWKPEDNLVPQTPSTLIFFFFFVRRFVIGLELSDKARQTGPWASWICLSSHLSTGLSVPATAQLFLLRFWGSNQLLMFAELALSQASPSPPHSQDLNLLRNRGFVQRFHKSWVEQSFFSYLWILYKFSIFGTDKLLLLFLPFNKVHCNLRRIVQV